MFDELKPLIQNGERFVLVEGGRPEYVFMRFQDYAGLIGTGRAARLAEAHRGHPEIRTADWERANAELGESLAEIGADFSVPETVPLAKDPSTIRLEDLPL
mgnify:CR=1 FL=1